MNFRGDGITGSVSDQTGTRESRTTNYEINKEEQQIVSNVGELRRLTVAVLIDGTYVKTDGTWTFMPRKSEELERVRQLVHNAVGLDTARGDALEVSSAPFTDSEPPKDPNFADMLADYAERNDLVVCSDEIHCGLILDADKRHIPFASLSPAAAQRSITLLAPSKTFNIPGLGCAFAVIPNPALRRRFERAMHGIVPHVNVLGLAACEAAFRHGGDWHRDLIAYLRGNRDRVAATMASLPGVRMAPVEATYLAWIDVRDLRLAKPAAHFEAHGIGLSDGADFGAPGWLRLNFGCPRATLDEALSRFERAVRAA